MSRMLSIVLLGTLLALTAAAQEIKVKQYVQSAAEQEFEAATDTTEIFTDLLLVARDFRDRYPDNTAVQMQVADILLEDNAPALRDYFKKRAKDNPDNISALYMAGYTSDLVADRKKNAEKILALEPDSYWGHLLQANSYYPDEDADLKKTEQSLRKAIKADNSQPMALEMLAGVLAQSERVDEARNVLAKLAEMLPDRFEPVQQQLMLMPGEFDEHLKLIGDFLKRNPDNVFAYDVQARIYREQNNWEGYIEAMQMAAGLSGEGVDYYNLACGFSLSGKADSAYARLFQATDAGFSDIGLYEEDDDLIPLRDDPRWSELLTRIETNRKSELQALAQAQSRQLGEEKREQLVERTQDKMAPNFTAKNFKGETVELSKLRGKVVVIDFWATWCGPCRKTMPLVDAFYKQLEGDEIQVYGLNVWERNGTGGVQPFIEQSGFSFPILLAANEVAADYGVRGIPTLFVIDKEGRIAYKHVGYNPQMMQILQAQTAELTGK